MTNMDQGKGKNPSEGPRSEPQDAATSPAGDFRSAMKDIDYKQVTPEMVDFSGGSPVISSAQKFILPVPGLGKTGEPLVYPDSHEKAGEQIVDWQGQPIGKHGVVFFNEKDQAYQAAPGDGKAVIIINEVTKDNARNLLNKVHEFVQDPAELTLEQLKEVLDYARQELRLKDMYNSDRDFIKSKMTPVDPRYLGHQGGEPIESFGLMKRDDRDICQAVFVPGPFQFEGPAATAQLFPDGGVIVQQGDSVRGIQLDVFLRTYTHSDGRAIKADDSLMQSEQ